MDVFVGSGAYDRDKTTGHGLPFTAARVRNIRRSYELATLESRLLRSGWLTRQEMATKLNISTSTVTVWSQFDLIAAKRSNSSRQTLHRLFTGNQALNSKVKSSQYEPLSQNFLLNWVVRCSQMPSHCRSTFPCVPLNESCLLRHTIREIRSMCIDRLDLNGL